MNRISLVFLCLLLFNSSLLHADWPHWRGTHRNDKSTEHSGWNGSKWELSDPVWTQQTGVGSASPLVIGNQVVMLGWNQKEKSGEDQLASYDLTTGKLLWQQKFPSPPYGRNSTGDKSFYSGPSSTPEYDPETSSLFTLSLDGELRCWNLKKKGQLLWKANLYDQFKMPRRPEVAVKRRTRRDYGYTSSPLVYKDWLLVEVGSTEEGNIIAFDKTNGKKVWGSECKDFAGHTGGPVILKVGGIDCVAILTLRNLVVMRLDGKRAGETVGTYKWTTDFGNNIPTPAAHENSLIISTAYNHYATCRVDFDLKTGARKIWETQNACTGVCSPIIDDGYVYWSWQGVHCLDFKTGKLVWKGGKTNTAGSCVLAKDKRLIVWANRGDLLLVENANESKDYKQLASKRLLSKTDAWPHVVVSDGHILCRDRSGKLLCLRISKQ